MTCTTPMVRPREMRGAHRTERVWNWVLLSNRRAKRGSFEVSLTMVGSPVWATQPAIPSPTFTRNDGDVFALLPQGQLEGQLLLLLVQHEDRPGLGGDQLLDLGHDQLDDLARLQDGVGRLHDVGEDGQALGGLAQLSPGVHGAGGAGRRAGRPGGGRAPPAPGGSPGRQEPRWKSKPSTRRALQRLGVAAQRQAAHRLVRAAPGARRQGARAARRAGSSTRAPAKPSRQRPARAESRAGGKNS